ncbi:hypothetical protein CAPTEDRAFT_193753 [Capitella teleta]|uniref:Uncharacterized protein n=1 Tax=Capitella teleta TaxID=283909 RepID=R7V8W2_CAPTE|nr:hypothetical protein CAPTEDRAFT_193753 [Capitella teleta]|eukprot:ELU15278.1 hypothetical protein CAPTEDRAFT_193753 [Capitella teleta]
MLIESWAKGSYVTVGYIIDVAPGNVLCCDTHDVQRIALDFQRHLHPGLVVRSIYARFNGTNPIKVQLWEKDTDRPNDDIYIFRWGTVITPRVADGNPEVIDLPESEWVTIKDSYKLGLVNEELPGPVEGYYDEKGSGVVLSLNKLSELGSIVDGSKIKFDDLKLPFHIPLFPCNESQCPLFIDNPPTLPPMIASDNDDASNPSYRPDQPAASSGEDDDMLKSREMVIGLIVWNLALTICLLLLAIAIIWICSDLERLDKRSRYQSQESGSGSGILNPGLSESKTELTPDVRQMRGEEEVQYYNLGLDPYRRSIERCQP